MSWQALAWGCKQPVGNASEKAVLWELCNHANKDKNHTAWPSIARLVERCAMCDSAVRRTIKRLVKRELVEVLGSKIRRHYRMMLENGVQDTPDSAPQERCIGIEARNIVSKERLSDNDPINIPLGAAAPAAGKTRKRATRLTADWQPSPEEIEWAKINRPQVDWREEAEKFRNYWIAKAGKDAAKADWPATWRNWIINAAKFARRGQPNASADAVMLASDEPWEWRISAYAKRKFWHAGWGDRPGGEDCRAPQELLARYGLAKVKVNA